MAAALLTPDLLENLQEKWTLQRAPVVEHLRPGLSPDQIDAMTEPLGVRLPTEARTWWSWHDGVSRTTALGAHRELGPSFPFLPLDEAATHYQHARQQAAEVAGDRADYWWRPSWFPITERRGEVRCECSVPAEAPCPIYWAYSHDHDAEGLTRPRVDSFGAMVAWWIEAIEIGAWQYNSAEGGWEYRPQLLSPDREASGLV